MTEKDRLLPSGDGSELHWHRFGAFHRHPDWHGHCYPGPFQDRCRFRCRHGERCELERLHKGSHRGAVVPYLHDCTYLKPLKHPCRRWHFHLPFRHRHTETGR